METTSLIPLDLETRLKLPEALQVPASWEEFLTVLPNCAYRLEYSAQQMRSFMGYATEQHEELIIRLGQLLAQLLSTKDYRFYGSNLALSPSIAMPSYYNADLTVIRGTAEKRKLRQGIQAVINPTLLIEVLSPSTYNYDLTQKLAAYRNIPSVEQVLYVDSSTVAVQTYTRLSEEKSWLFRTFDHLDDKVPILEQDGLSLAMLYENIDFSE